MHVVKDTSKRTEKRGLKRYFVDTQKEAGTSLLPRRVYRCDDAGNVFETKKAAAEYSAVLAQRISGGAIVAEDKTFGDAVAQWEVDRKEKRHQADTIVSDIAAVHNHILGKWTLNGVPIAKAKLLLINYAQLKAELTGKRGHLKIRHMNGRKRMARSGVRDILNLFKAILEVAVEERWISHNPASKISVEDAEIQDPDDKAIDPEVYGNFRDNIPDLLRALAVIDPASVFPVEVLLKTGVRGGELVALSLNQVTIKHNKTVLKINRAWKKDKVIGKPKSGLTRYVVVSPQLGADLKAHAVANKRRGDDLLFGENGKILDRPGLTLRWRQAQFAIRGWGLFRSSNTRSSGRSWNLVKLPKPITDFDHDEWQSFAFGQAGLSKGEQRDALQFDTFDAAAQHIRLTLFRPHDIRHLYASHLLSVGESLSSVAGRIGDQVDTLKKYYAHYLPEDDAADQRVIDAMEAIC